VGYGADVVDITVNQSDLIINRNNGMKNGNVVMTGLGGGGVLKHKHAYALYPNYATNSAYALQIGLAHASQLTLRSLGSDTLYLDDALMTTGKVGVGTTPSASLHLKAGSSTPGSAPLKLTPGAALAVPEDDAIEYHDSHLYFTTGLGRYQLDRQASNTLLRTPVADVDYTVLQSDVLIAYTTLTASRAVTLPAPGTMANMVLTIKDETGAAATYPITVLGTVDGATTTAIASNYGSLELYSTGVAWFTK
jgi:hypothetical protein